jgi:hypothetical protein
MDRTDDLTALESGLYRTAYSDGIIDLFFGFSLLFIGTIWIWAPEYGGLAGVIPAVMAPTLLPLRRQVVDPRGGYVKWGKTRRRWEKRNLWAMALAGLVVFVLGISAFLLAGNSSQGTDVLSDIAPGLLAFILAFVAVGLGFMMEARRMFLYAAALAIGGVLTVLSQGRPGWPLFGAGIVIVITGTVMLVRYLKENPVVRAP